MDVLITVLGVVLIVTGIYDIYRTLFLPSGKGLISERLEHAVWRGCQRFMSRQPSRLRVAGPFAFLATAGAWTLLMVLGWALIYWPWMPGAFSYSPGLIPENNAGFLDAVYLSLVTLATLGYGDITPDANWILLSSPLQGLVGFALLTAVIAWLLSIYPNLSRRQAFARGVSLLQSAEQETGIDLIALDAGRAAQILGELTSELVAIRGNMEQFPIIYYFHADDDGSSLAVVMPYVLSLATSGSSANQPPEVRLGAHQLRGAIDDLAETLATRFLDVSPEPVERVLEAYRRDHFHSG